MKPPSDPHVRRRFLEAGFWILAVCVLWGLDLLTKFGERQRSGYGLDDFRLVTEQATSAAAALVMVPFVIWWVRRFPLRRGRIALDLLAHAAGSIVFTLGHYALMVLLRIPVFHFNGMAYSWRQSHWSNLVYEYQQDVAIYAAMVAVVAGYRHIRRRPAEPGARAIGPEEDAPRRMLVQTGTGERLLDIDVIEYIEAARNYVAIHADGKEFLVRDTLAGVEARLPGRAFLRTHRSFLVNVEMIEELRPTGAGAYELRMRGGAVVPLSRSYRDSVKRYLRRLAAT